MKVLFVYRLNTIVSDRPAERQFARFLTESGVITDIFILRGNARKAYTKGALELYRHLRNNHYDLIHGFYSYTSMVAALVSPVPVICSLIGSDLMQASSAMRRLISIFSRIFWKRTFVMSQQMQKVMPGTIILPTGVDFSAFYPADRATACHKVGFDPDKYNIIFITSAIERPVKNLPLAQKGVAMLPADKFAFHVLVKIPHAELVHYYNAADLLLMTSLSEGSPNVVKEALACNCPVLSTDVGDVAERIDGVAGCRITAADPHEIARHITELAQEKAICNGRTAITALDWKNIATTAIKHYKAVLGKD